MSQDEQNEYDRPSKSSGLIIYWAYFIYGVAMLLPWNVFITASEYFSYRFQGSGHEENFQNYFSAYSNCANLVALAVLLWLRRSQMLSKMGVFVPLTINALIFLFYMITSLMTAISADFYFKITILFMVVTGITTAMLQLSVLADASQLLPKYMQGVMSGQGIAGVSVSLFSFLTMILGGDGRSVFFYFFSAFLVTLSGIIGRFMLQRNTEYQRMLRTSDTNMEMVSVEEEEGHTSQTNVTMRDIVFRKSTGYISTVIYIYVITLALFPSITVQVTSANGIESSIFMSFHFLLFNIGDWIGRTLPIFEACQVSSSRFLLGLALLRTLFLPVFTSLAEDRIHSDFLFFSSVLLLSISNGWLTSLVFMAAPKNYPIASKPLVGSIMSFALVIGLALGGVSSFLVLKLLS